MRHDSRQPLDQDDGEQLTAPQGVPYASSFPVSSKGEGALRMLRVSELAEQCLREIQAYRCRDASTDVYGVELLRRATVQGDQEAWTSLQQCLAELVRGWLRRHPSCEVAARLDSEENYVALALERFWQVAFRTLAGALAYLCASLNGAILDTLRTSSRPRGVPMPSPGEPTDPLVEDQTDSSEVWELLKQMLPNVREQRLAFLLFQCGLKPREIVRFCQEEWTDIQEIYRLHRNILERLLCNADEFRWRFDLQEQV